MSDLAHTRSADAPWKDALRAAYLDGRANVFLLHGAVSDFQWSSDGLTSLAGAVTELLGRSRSFVVAVDGAGDAWLSAVSDPASVRTAFAWARPGTRDASAVLEGGPGVVLPALGRLLGTPAHPCGVIIVQAELLLGRAQDVPSRAAVAQVRRWLDSPHMRATNNAAVLVADTPDAISPLLAGHPRLVPIEVGLPAVAEAVALIRAELGGAVEGLGTDRLSAAVQGCTLVDVAALCSRLAGVEPEVLSAQFPPVSSPPADVLDVPEPPASLAPAAESPDV